ncbi:hypothetical protein [Lacrimispora sp.]|jgi:hypothetical protein|uniref:hypothetical protein n=1 Tax=Lacrimispora sp. TaxID=2719234 RepID=UPI00289E28D8|nr:hypothetical protein [Lacrimispora sp.]
MNHEKIKISDTTLDIAAGSCGLDRPGDTATVAIIIGSHTINDIHKALTSSGIIIKYDMNGVEEWRKDNLVYTGKMTLRSDFPVGIEQRQTGVEDGKPIYSNVEVLDAVVIVEYRLPTMQDEMNRQSKQIVGLNAQVAYLSMMSGIDVEEV